jgi:hypothetical protein
VVNADKSMFIDNPRRDISPGARSSNPERNLARADSVRHRHNQIPIAFKAVVMTAGDRAYFPSPYVGSGAVLVGATKWRLDVKGIKDRPLMDGIRLNFEMNSTPHRILARLPV